MLLTLRIVLIVLGASAIAIAASDIFLGPDWTAGGAKQAFGALTGYGGPPSGHWPTTMDNEMRFYAALWAAYGITLILVARGLAARGCFVPWLAAVFFAGGVGRAISYVSVGPPHPFFTLLMAIELGLPAAIMLLWLATRQAR
jgi:hypothetical protein